MKFGPAVAKSLSEWAQGTNLVKKFGTLASFAREAKTSALGYILFYVQDPRLRGVMLSALEALDTGRAVASTLTKALDRPLGVLGKVITKIDEVNPGQIGMQKLFEKLGTKIDGPRKGQALLNAWALERDAVALQGYIKGVAVSAERMDAFIKEGDDLAKVADALEGMAVHHPRSDTPGYFKSMKLGTRTEDFHVSFRTETEAGAAVYRDTFANAKHNPLPDGRLKVIGLERVYPKLYKYVDASAFKFVERARKVMGPPASGHYLTPTVFDGSASAKNGLQLPHKDPPIPVSQRARYRIEVDTADVTDNLHVPVGKDLANDAVRVSSEPIVTDNPLLGGGGHAQFTTPKELKIISVYDYELGRFLGLSEWP